LKYNIVSFDFGGTLAYEVKGEGAVLKSILNRFGVEVDLQRLRKAFEEARGWWREERSKGVIWNELGRINFVRILLSNLGLTSQDDGLVELVARAWPEAMEFRPYDDTKTTLEVLRSMGFKLIVISNVSSGDALLKYIAKVGLSEYFEFLVASGNVGFEKPDSRIFLMACATARTNPERMVHIGDDYEKDYLGALRSGLGAVLVDRTGRYQDETLTKVRSLRELPDVITGPE